MIHLCDNRRLIGRDHAQRLCARKQQRVERVAADSKQIRPSHRDKRTKLARLGLDIENLALLKILD